MSDLPPSLVGPCNCEERHEAQHAGRLVYLYTREVWIMTDIPVRRQSPIARSYAAVHGTDDHTGESFTIFSCPWCGFDLPVLEPIDGEYE
jgi:hypothetical protein